MAPLDSSRPVPARAGFAGIALMALSATGYGLVPIFARFAYDAGATPLTLLGLRYTVVSAALLAVLRARGRPLALPAGRRYAGVVTGGMFAVIAYAYLAAIRLVPVSSAVLLFFTYPLLVVLIGWSRGERPGLRRILAVIAAFIGLAVALGVEIGGLDPLGVWLAVVGSLTYTVGIFYFGRTAAGADPMVLTLHAMGTCAVLFMPLAAAAGALVVPATTLGIVGVVGVVVTYFTGVVAFFAALARIGPVKTALLSQLEPVVSILAAVLVLREQLSLVQGLGVILLLGALMVLAG